MNWHDHIHTDPAVLLGKPIVEGTRLCVPIDGHVLVFFHPLRCAKNRTAQVVKVEVFTLPAFRALMGSTLAFACFRCPAVLSRASAGFTSG